MPRLSWPGSRPKGGSVQARGCSCSSAGGPEGQPVKPREKRLVLVLGAAAAVAALRTWWLPHKCRVAVSGNAAVDPTPETVPRIARERLPHERPKLRIGLRDIFAFGPPPPLPPTPRPPTTPTPTADPQEALVPTPLPGPRLPPLTLKYIGSAEKGRGARVAPPPHPRHRPFDAPAPDEAAHRHS